ncbi:MAG TPA: DUF302 domain-containing protein [Chromatiales bacterium]|nr:DUF302 domain-containing protein [Chromatiales bacterium]
MRYLLIATLALFGSLSIPPAHAGGNGLITLRSAHSMTRTIQRLRSALRAKGMSVFARIDHARGAGRVGLELRPTTLLIFGNPKMGTLLMECKQGVGIDLPQKMLAWRDARGRVWLTYNDPRYLAGRHHLGRCGAATIRKMSVILRRFAKAAVAP